MSIIAPEGYRDRVAEETPQWVCGGCYHKMTLKLPSCPACGMRGPFAPTKTPQRYHAETKAIIDSKKVKGFSPGFDSTKKESQFGTSMLPDQLFAILKQAISGLQVKLVSNLLGPCYALYAPIYCKPWEEQFLSDQERHDRLQHVCNCPIKIITEWDLDLTDEQGHLAAHVPGWRGIFGKFYRLGLIKWMPPDDGRRLSLWTIKQSPLNKPN